MREAKLRSGRSSTGSIASMTTLSSISQSSMSSTGTPRSPNASSARSGGLLGWIVGKAVQKLTSMVEGHEFLRTLSNPAMHGFGMAEPPSPTLQRHVCEVADEVLE
eukprot:CAMPEP_0170612816 /NCGR_PEP_ID=MMETSP0224-20130122/23930_1 /TAXON_ID=285029 /ORGANISM="Togula jolla, Strain CCCM 725" /LENGTH=105 /DNA_ID=CAMNT_0010938355 /DNA_START=313 /DNA_END=630 /DNA_ORIENTATION=+